MNTLEGKRVLVTGGAGFIGSFVVTELLKEKVSEVIIYDNLAGGDVSYVGEQLKDPRCRLFKGDLREIDLLNTAMDGCDYVVHLAAMWLLHCKDYPRTAFDVNIKGTFNVLEACVNNQVSRLVYSSSASVYGDATQVPRPRNILLIIAIFMGPANRVVKLCVVLFMIVTAWIMLVCYMNVYGPHQDQTAAYTGVVPIMLNKIDANEPPQINGDGTQAYDFIYVEDVARSNVCALKATSTDEFYNVGSGVQTSIAELCNLILELKQSDLQVTYRPYSEDDARRMVQNRIGCPEKASRESGV